eukprot:2430257-Pyramimonas_sp.AAC.1
MGCETGPFRVSGIWTRIALGTRYYKCSSSYAQSNPRPQQNSHPRAFALTSLSWMLILSHAQFGRLYACTSFAGENCLALTSERAPIIRANYMR